MEGCAGAHLPEIQRAPDPVLGRRHHHYGLLAIFPAIAALVAVYGRFGDPAAMQDELHSLANVMPGGAIEVISDQIEALTAQPKTAIGITFDRNLLGDPPVKISDRLTAEDVMDSFQESREDTGSSERQTEPDSSLSAARSIAQDAADKVAQIAGHALDQVKSSGSSLATAATDGAKDLLERKKAIGGQWIGQLAESTKVAADHLDTSAPEIAGLMRQASASIEQLATELQNRSVGELVQTASDFARRRPEVVFGVAALFGFLAFRVLTSAGSTTARNA